MLVKSTVQSFDRGLDVLSCLNVNNGSSISEISKMTRINRGTVYRLLETLRRRGLIRKDSDDSRYWLDGAVQQLSDGYVEEAWIDNLIVPRLAALTDTQRWPLSFCAPSGTTMLVRATMDFQSPLTLRRFPVGYRVSMVSSSVGLAYLSACATRQRDAMIEVLLRTVTDKGELATLKKSSFEQQLNDISNKGFAFVAKQALKISGIAVPITAGKAVLGAIAIRFFSSALSQKQAVIRYVPLLQQAAAEIKLEFESL